ncbi:MAG: imidazoleglycerol-phosphate dehydratase HisB [Eubacteriales bacterium]|nr:imidazoleglycerol-phosphate dehydratase HisB [Eubacteriales bacterium]
MRNAGINRKTSETDVRLRLELDGTGRADINTGIGFLDHMLQLFAVHGRFDLEISCTGDTYVDDHHSTEDIGISLGTAFAEALGDKRGIRRYGDILLPMDEALILAAVDISGRSFLGYGLRIETGKVGSFDTELAEEFWTAFTRSSGICLHLKQLDGKNTHHILEGSFKAAARALRTAVSVDPEAAGDIPSSKGVL